MILRALSFDDLTQGLCDDMPQCMQKTYNLPTFINAFDDSADFRLALVLWRRAEQKPDGTWVVTVSGQDLGAECWPKALPATQRMRVCRSLRRLIKSGFVTRISTAPYRVAQHRVNVEMLGVENVYG